MYRTWLAALLLSLLLLLTSGALAAPATWQTDAAVGPSDVLYTIELTCPNPGFVCDLIDGYLDQDTSTSTGSGSFELDDLLGEMVFDSDSMQDVGSGLQPAYLTMTGTDVAFANIPFAGIPEISDLLTFALTSPTVTIPGFDLLIPGDYPFSETFSYSGTGTVFGDLEFVLGPAIIVPPAAVSVSGVFRVLGDIDSDGNIEYELRDVVGTFAFQNFTTIGGEPVTLDVTASMMANLSGETEDPTPELVPVLGPIGLTTLVAALSLLGGVLQRRS